MRQAKLSDFSNPSCEYSKVWRREKYCLHPKRNALIDWRNIKSAPTAPRHNETRTFRSACCSKLGISNEEFKKRVVMECLPWYHWLSGRIWWKFNQAYFQPDVYLLRSVANYTEVNEIIMAINELHKREYFVGGFGRNTMRFRLSCRLLIKLAKRVFSAN